MLSIIQRQKLLNYTWLFNFFSLNWQYTAQYSLAMLGRGRGQLGKSHIPKQRAQVISLHDQGHFEHTHWPHGFFQLSSPMIPGVSAIYATLTYRLHIELGPPATAKAFQGKCSFCHLFLSAIGSGLRIFSLQTTSLNATSHSHGHVNIWSPVDGTVWGGSGGMVLLEELCHWRWLWKLKDSAISSLLLFQLTVEDPNRQLPAPTTFTLPSRTLNLWKLNPKSALSSISFLGHVVLSPVVKSR